jgi:S1-C subfamily serine protease
MPTPFSARALVAGVFLAALPILMFGAAETPKAAPAVAESVPAPAGDPIENSVVKIFSTMRGPDLARPWTKQSPSEVSGTGIVIEGKRILTNAHVVTYASQVQVQANQAGDKLSAVVESIAPGIDLAVVRLEDETFFDTHPALPRASLLSQTKDPVLVYGYPTGGNSLSITKGIVSRIEFAGYKYPVSGLRLQIDAAINPGNSGGPAIVNDKVIGLAFSHLNNAQNIGYIIPSEEIDLFLHDVADGKYDGKPALYDEFQTLENTALRSYLKLDKNVHGVVVQEPFRRDADYPLHTWDVVTKIGDSAIDDQGMIKIGDAPRLRFAYAVQKTSSSGTVPLTLIREGKELQVDVPVSADRPKLIPFLEGTYPSYFIYGPLVFCPVTENIVTAITANGATGTALTAIFSQRGSPLITRRGDQPSFPGEELVMIPSPFFPHRLSKGYSSPAGRVVQSVNGVLVKNLLHLVELLRDSKAEFTVFDFAGHGGEAVVLPHKECLAATDEILTDNGVRAQGSADTLTVWNAKPAAAAASPTKP